MQTNSILYHALNPSLYQHNIRYFGRSAFEWAICNGVTPVVRRMLEGVHPDNKLLRGKPMELAIRHGHADVVRVLLDYGLHPDPAGWVYSIPGNKNKKKKFRKYPNRDEIEMEFFHCIWHRNITDSLCCGFWSHMRGAQQTMLQRHSKAPLPNQSREGMDALHMPFGLHFLGLGWWKQRLIVGVLQWWNFLLVVYSSRSKLEKIMAIHPYWTQWQAKIRMWSVFCSALEQIQIYILKTRSNAHYLAPNPMSHTYWPLSYSHQGNWLWPKHFLTKGLRLTNLRKVFPNEWEASWYMLQKEGQIYSTSSACGLLIIEPTDSNVQRALWEAVGEGNRAIVEYLLKRGCRPCREKECTGRSTC